MLFNPPTAKVVVERLGGVCNILMQICFEYIGFN